MKCTWVKPGVYEEYHDLEHGKLLTNNQELFERIVLEIMQPGLSFEIVLKKREGLSEAFANYDFDVLSSYDEFRIQKLMNNQGIIRNRQKIEAVIHNAKIVREIIKEQSLIDYLVDLLDYRLDNQQMIKLGVKLLKNDGFKFIGPSVFESILTSLGLLAGHMENCELANFNREYTCALLTPFGMLEVRYMNYQITYSRFNDAISHEISTGDSYEYVIRRQLTLYNLKALNQFKLRYSFDATEFQKQVYDVIIHSNFGDYYTYKEVAHKINSRGYQAVGSALNKNKIQFFIPCHRVGNQNQVGGFASDEMRKIAMLKYENANIPQK